MGIVKLSTAGILDYQKYSNFLAGNAPVFVSAYDLLETEILTSDTGTVTFSNLDTYASDYQHLQMRIVATAGGSGWTNRMRIKVNGSDANLRRHDLIGNGSSAGSNNESPYGGSLVLSSRLDVVNPSAFIIDFLDFGSTSKTKTFRFMMGCNDANEPYVALGSVLWNSTSAFTSILFGCGNTTIDTNFVTGSRWSLYGLKAA